MVAVVVYNIDIAPVATIDIEDNASVDELLQRIEKEDKNYSLAKYYALPKESTSAESSFTASDEDSDLASLASQEQTDSENYIPLNSGNLSDYVNGKAEIVVFAMSS
ncbi:hypothetical protein LPJ78_002608 [Coemansia sp. RSA 989]|nr:hypothetical protein LPJ68_001153 [Coemansia sp. RSA 1086]KAJ1751877.1 hypothetical protein LPJ79_001719 [Coemansia sp. RSA 1821]KAJ1865528.1 hypothetical protein LPJ78_002608 [Coemansia sp. RSA 989]KAJ1873963.1 hypothetical protein LPJ55_001894 [Coemansia sp. RSA 990]